MQFGNDLDRAAYIIRSKSKKSKGEDRIIASLEEQGLDVAAVRKHGEKVKKAISDQVLDMTGSRRAPQSSMEIRWWQRPFGDEVSYSVEGERIVLMPTLSNGSGKRTLSRPLRQAVAEIVSRTSGGGGKVKIRKGQVEMLIPPEHGGDGKRKG